MDAVYILGSGSPVKNAEIKISVRALDLNMADLRDVYIVGESVDFLPGAKHIPAADAYEERWKNAYKKISLACENEAISDPFLLMNDDFIMQEPFTGADFPYYALKDSNGGACGPHWFGVHCPLVVHKKAWRTMPFSLDQNACQSPRSFYGNFGGCPPTFTKDYTVNLYPQLGTFDEQASGRAWYTFSNITAGDERFMAWLKSRYPKPSRFE